MDYTTLDDKTLMLLLSRSHTDALGVLYDRYGSLVYSVAHNSVGDPGLAEEITQDVFLRAWEKASLYQADRGQVSTWLTSMARHRAIDMLRRRGARAEHRSVGWSDIEPYEIAAEEKVETTAALALEQERVRAAILELPQDQQQTLALAYFGGYSQREIAETLNQPVGTVKTRIRLAMQKLRRALLVDSDPGT